MYNVVVEYKSMDKWEWTTYGPFFTKDEADAVHDLESHIALACIKNRDIFDFRIITIEKKWNV